MPKPHHQGNIWWCFQLCHFPRLLNHHHHHTQNLHKNEHNAQRRHASIHSFIHPSILTWEIGTLHLEGFDGVLHSLCQTHVKIFHVFLHCPIEAVLRDYHLWLHHRGHGTCLFWPRQVTPSESLRLYLRFELVFQFAMLNPSLRSSSPPRTTNCTCLPRPQGRAADIYDRCR